MNENHRNDGSGHNQGGNRNHSAILLFLVVTLITLLIMSFVNRMMSDSTSEEITYDQFLALLDRDLVDKVTIGPDKLTIVTKNQPLSGQGIEYSYFTGRVSDPDLVSRLEKAGRHKQQMPPVLNPFEEETK